MTETGSTRKDGMSHGAPTSYRFDAREYDVEAREALLKACACATPMASAGVALAARVLDQFEYFTIVGDTPPDRSVSDALRQGALTCLEAALVAMDIAFQEGIPAYLMAMTRRDPTSGGLLGHAAYIYQNAAGLFGSLAFSRHALQGHRMAEFRSKEDVAISYAHSYVRLGLMPLCFGIADAAVVTDGLQWRTNAQHMACLHARLQETQEFALEVEFA